MAQIATGLRKKFGSFAPMVSPFYQNFCLYSYINFLFKVAPVILEKFKEKKPVVANAMVECIDAISKTVRILKICLEFC